MDQNFQTSFIPKKPIIEKRATSSRPVGIFTIISFLIFFSILVASAGLYLYKGIITKKISSMKTSLELSKHKFEDTKISQLQLLDRRLRGSTDILSKHISVVPIFKVLESVTMKNIRYTKFSYTVNTEKETKINVKLSGQADGYRPIALQSDLFTTKGKSLIDPVFSNLVLNDKGSVMFELSFSVDPSFVNYKKNLLAEGDDPGGNVKAPTQTTN
jgi:hypothetical protein